MDSISFEGYEYDPETKIRKGKAQEELFDPVDGMTELQKMATGETLRTHSHEEHVLDRPVPWGDPL
jgi:hypothetical protein